MALGDCCKRMGLYVAQTHFTGHPTRKSDRQCWLLALHRCPWCFARVNTDKPKGGDAKEELSRTTS